MDEYFFFLSINYIRKIFNNKSRVLKEKCENSKTGILFHVHRATKI